MSETVTTSNGHAPFDAAAFAPPSEPPAAEPGGFDFGSLSQGQEPELRPVIPPHLQRKNLPGTARRTARITGHKTLYHGIRSPWYLIRYLWHAVRGAHKLTWQVIRWWHWLPGHELESAAVAAGRPGHHEAMRAHTEGKKTRGVRGRILAICLVVALLPLLLMALYSPWWGWAILGGAAVLRLARHGKPEGTQVIKPAVLVPQLEPVTETSFTRALVSTGISEIKRLVDGGGHLDFIAPGVGRDGPGWTVVLDLPHGVTVEEVNSKRDKLAAGLRRPLACVWPEGDRKQHPGRLVTYICDESLNEARQPAWPLASAQRFSLFDRVPFGTDQRMRPVTFILMFANMLIGSISRMGKTVALLNALLAAALDPTAELHVHELKGTGDLDPLERIAHCYGSGTDDETIEAALADLRRVHAELDRRAKVIKGLPADRCPQKKVTPELAADRSLGLHPLVFAIDECQEAFGHRRLKGEFEELCLQVIRRGPALGIMLLLSTQRPESGSLPTAITANMAMRFCLKVMDQISNDMVLGTSARRRGQDASLFAWEDKGIGWAIGLGPDPLIVKTYDIDVRAAERIAQRAYLTRKAAGRLTGHAAGEDTAEPDRSFTADVLDIFDADDKLWTATIADRLSERMPDVYKDITPAAVASQLRAKRVRVKNVREPGRESNQGCERTDVEAVTW